MKTTLFQLLFNLHFTVLAIALGNAQDTINPTPLSSDSSEIIINQTKNDSILGYEKNETENDSILNDSITKPKSFLEGIVDYKSKDITSINLKKKQIYLYNEAEIQYKNMDIKAGVIIIDYGKEKQRQEKNYTLKSNLKI